MSPFFDHLNPILSLALLAIGFFCLVTRRRVLKQIVGLSIMLQGALLALLDAGLVNAELERAQSMIVSALVAEAIMMAIALSLTVNVFRFYPMGLADDLDLLKG